MAENSATARRQLLEKMSVLQQPFARTLGQRDDSGCLTPSNGIELGADSKDKMRMEEMRKFGAKTPRNTEDSEGTHSILSPPLSPYQRGAELAEEDGSASAAGAALQPSHGLEPDHSLLPEPAVKLPIGLHHTFPIRDFKKFELKVDAWSGLGKGYKERQLKFLEQYSFISDKEQTQQNTRRQERRAAAKRRIWNLESDGESSQHDRVRTRRIARESSAVPGTDVGESSFEASPAPKKKKPRKETPNPHTSAQQASYIDENIPDYSPDVSTLPKNNNRALKVEWKGQPMDLKSDPNADKLHPAELLLASILRLPCNVYIDSKRRLFYEKVNRLKNGMQFRRTDAQKSCRIDVNKASRLYAAFEKVGWLDDLHFEKYL